MISAAEVQHSLKTKFLGQTIHTFEVVDSTNTVAKKLAETGAPEGTIVVAEYQAAGRGRYNRKWYGERGKNILLSLVLRPLGSELTRLLTYLTAVCAAEVAEDRTKKRVKCKWPNDLLLNGKKFCGILLECSWQESTPEYVIVGLGMNVNQENFPNEVRSTATSLKIECGREVDRVGIIRSFLQHLETRYLQSRVKGYGSVLAAWETRCSMFGKEITIDRSGEVLTGRAIRLDSDGALVIKNHRREIRIFAGDVTVLS